MNKVIPICANCGIREEYRPPLRLAIWVQPINEQYDAGEVIARICDDCFVVNWATEYENRKHSQKYISLLKNATKAFKKAFGLGA